MHNTVLYQGCLLLNLPLGLAHSAVNKQVDHAIKPFRMGLTLLYKMQVVNLPLILYFCAASLLSSTHGFTHSPLPINFSPLSSNRPAMACAARDLKLNICASQDNYLSSSQMRRITDVVSTDYLSVVKCCKTTNHYSLVVIGGKSTTEVKDFGSRSESKEEI